MKMYGKKLVFILGILFIISLPIFALTGEVISVSGKVEVESPSGWVPLKVGDIVESGYVISTGFRSKAEIKVAGSVITLNPLTRLTLEQLSENGEAHSSEVFLDIGTLGADVQKAENKRVNFKVNTPVATASVRGTRFEMDRNKLTVLRGQVDLVAKKNVKKNSSASGKVEESLEESEQKPQPVSAGNSSSVSSTGKTSNPLTERVNNALGIVSDADTDSVGPISVASMAARAAKTKTVVAPSTTDVTVTFSAK